jgi:hypothetical protein
MKHIIAEKALITTHNIIRTIKTINIQKNAYIKLSPTGIFLTSFSQNRFIIKKKLPERKLPP